MNKILFIISDLELGGTQRVLINIANHFSKTYRIVILTLYDKKKTNTNFEIKFVSAKNKQKKRNISINKKKWLKNYIEASIHPDIDIVIELIGGSEGPAKKLVFNSLKNKKHVITANKALMAKYGDQLAILAEKNNVNLEYEASVAGGVPIIRTIKESLIANKITKIYGILNGTTNFILSSFDMFNSTKSKSLSFFDDLERV